MSALLSLALLCLVGCDRPNQAQGFSISDAAIRVTPGTVHVRLDQQLQLSPEATEALEHGVPLSFTLSLELRNAETLNLIQESQHRYTVSFLPLSQHYQLETDGDSERRTYPRLRHVIAAINQREHQLQGTPLTAGEYLVRSRIQLDLGALPGPMQLPAVLSAHWDLDSEWTNWPFSINA